MSDVNTKEEMVKVLKEECTLRKVLTAKTCPFAGASGNHETCGTCTNDWMGAAGRLQDLIGERKVNAERSEQQMKLISAELDGVRTAMTEMTATTGIFADVFQKAIEAFAATMREVADKIQEKKSKKKSTTKKTTTKTGDKEDGGKTGKEG